MQLAKPNPLAQPCDLFAPILSARTVVSSLAFVLFIIAVTLFESNAYAEPAKSKRQSFKLIWSEDVNLCKPLTNIFNPPIIRYRFSAFRNAPYFRDVPWQTVRFRISHYQQERDTLLVDLNNDGINELILPFFSHTGGDDRESWLEILPASMISEGNAIIYEAIEKARLWKISPGAIGLHRLGNLYPAGSFGDRKYDRPQVIDNVEYAEVNDFEVLAVSGKYYVSMRSYYLGDNRRELAQFRKWQIVARMKWPTTVSTGLTNHLPLDDLLEPVCLFVLNQR